MPLSESVLSRIEGIPAGVRAFFTRRAAGSMKDPAARERALEAAGLAGRPALFLRQVHGARVVAAQEPLAPPEADGWVSERPGLVLCVYMADCVPLFLWEKDGRAVGVFHAGWRGMAAGMPRAAVEAFERLGVSARDLRGALGPHIGACCFEVGPETARAFPEESRRRRGERVLVDLAGEAERQLRDAGAPAPARAGGCTRCEADEYFSFRREKSDNRLMAFITLDA